MKKLFLIIGFVLAAIGMSLGQTPYMTQGNKDTINTRSSSLKLTSDRFMLGTMLNQQQEANSLLNSSVNYQGPSMGYLNNLMLYADSSLNYNERIYKISFSLTTVNAMTLTNGGAITGSTASITSPSLNFGLSNYQIIGGYASWMGTGSSNPVNIVFYTNTVTIPGEGTYIPAATQTGTNVIDYCTLGTGYTSVVSHSYLAYLGHSNNGNGSNVIPFYNPIVYYSISAASGPQTHFASETLRVVFYYKKSK